MAHGTPEQLPIPGLIGEAALDDRPLLWAPYPRGFYAKLAQVLGDPHLRHVMYRGHGDRLVMHMMAMEQLSRASVARCHPYLALGLSFMTAEFPNDNEWGASFNSDKWAYGDLLVNGGDLRWACAPIKCLVEVHGDGPGRYALTTRDEGEIAGFDRSVGDGWTLYRKVNPIPAPPPMAPPVPVAPRRRTPPVPLKSLSIVRESKACQRILAVGGDRLERWVRVALQERDELSAVPFYAARAKAAADAGDEMAYWLQFSSSVFNRRLPGDAP